MPKASCKYVEYGSLKNIYVFSMKKHCEEDRILREIRAMTVLAKFRYQSIWIQLGTTVMAICLLIFK